MSQKAKSDATHTIGDTTKQDTKDKKRPSESVAELLSKEYKKPRKLKQLTFDTTPVEEPQALISRSKNRQLESKAIQSWPQDDMVHIKDRLEQIITRQGTAQGCIERLLEIFTREAHEDSSTEDVGLIKD